MYVRIGARKLFLFLLIATVVNADRIKETTLAYNINVRCVALGASFEDVSCEQGFIISVLNAYYGYYASNRYASESCSIEDDCFESVTFNSPSYYDAILAGCNGEERCASYLEARSCYECTSCGLFTANDYVSIEFFCLPSDISSTLVSKSSTTKRKTTSTTTRTVPVTSVAVSKWRKRTTKTPTTPSTVTVTSVTASKWSRLTTTSTTPSTITVTSVATSSSSSLYASSTTGGATIGSDASTYTMVDNLGNVSTTVADASSTDNTTSIIVGCVVGGVVLIIVLLLLIFIVRRTRNSEDTFKRRGNSSDKGVNGPLSDNTSIPTHSLGNHPATALCALEHDQPHPPMYWLAQEPSIAANSLAREQLADCYSEVEDLEQEPYRYLSLYSNQRFYEEIDKPNAGIYVNVTQPSNAAYSLVQKTNSTTHPKVEDPVGSASLPVDKSELAKVNIDKEEEKVSALTRHQSIERPSEDDLVLRDNSLYVATETHSPNDAVDELTLTDNDLYV